MKKRIKVTVLIMLLFSIALPALFAAAYGDADGSGAVDILDALMTARYSVGFNPAGFDPAAADVSGDGAADIVDALLIARYSVGLITMFPVEGSSTPEPSSGTFPYAPYNYIYGQSSVAGDQEAENSYVEQEYASWKARYLTTSGAGGFIRVRRPEDNNDSVSEGIAYGMLFAVYMDEKENLDGLWNYAKAHLDARGLMHWQINSSGQVIGQNAATDAEQDMALALIFAHKKWGDSRYRTDAINIINAMMEHEIESGTYVLKPGDVWGGSDCTNISYYAPGTYKIFAQYTGDTRWNNVVDKCYEIIETVQAKKNTVLVPDWCTAAGDSAGTVSWDQYKDHYFNDAVRFPWRIAADYLWFGDSRAYENCNDITAFFAQIGPANIKGGYYLNGTPIRTIHDPAYVGTTGAGAMASNNRSFAEAMYDEIKITKDSSYYDDCLRLFSLLMMTGNFPNIYDL